MAGGGPACALQGISIDRMSSCTAGTTQGCDEGGQRHGQRLVAVQEQLLAAIVCAVVERREDEGGERPQQCNGRGSTGGPTRINMASATLAQFQALDPLATSD